MAGQLVVLHRCLAVRAVDHIQQGGVLHLQTFICLDGLQTNAVGGVGVAVLVHHLLGIAVGRSDLLVGQLTTAVSPLSESVVMVSFRKAFTSVVS